MLALVNMNVYIPVLSGQDRSPLLIPNNQSWKYVGAENISHAVLNMNNGHQYVCA